MSTKEGTKQRKVAPVAQAPVAPVPSPKPASFGDQDTEKVIEFLNFVANHAEFGSLDVKKMLQFTKLLNWFQTGLLPKMDAHKFEILKVEQSKGK